MTEDEAETLAKAYLDMQRHYAPVISGKTMDTLRFGMVFTTMYAGRIIRRNMRVKQEAADKKAGKAPTAAAPIVQAPMPTKGAVNGAAHVAKPMMDPIFTVETLGGADLGATRE